MAKQQAFPGFKLPGSGKKAKLVGLVLVGLLVWRVIVAPVETAHAFDYVVSQVQTFFNRF
ncbi:hypothetical protein ACWEHA_09525 [Amycolatopsis nivea]|uniref:hypothetical protein n=1 Tax=unclassified Amycolatopsis TaxID=2618356 RepID=UPI003671F39F